MPTNLPTRPLSFRPRWNTDLFNNSEPTELKKSAGWVVGEEPSSAFFNWWQNSVFRWQEWSENAIDEINAEKIDNFFIYSRSGTYPPTIASSSNSVRNSNFLPFVLWNNLNSPESIKVCGFDLVCGFNNTLGFRFTNVALPDSIGLAGLRIEGLGSNRALVQFLDFEYPTNTQDSRIISHVPFRPFAGFDTQGLFPVFNSDLTLTGGLTSFGPVFSAGLFPNAELETAVNIGGAGIGEAFASAYIYSVNSMERINYSSLQNPSTNQALMSDCQVKTIVALCNQFSNTATPNLGSLRFNVSNIVHNGAAGDWTVLLDTQIHLNSIALATVITDIGANPNHSVCARAVVSNDGGSIRVFTYSNNSPSNQAFSLAVYGIPRSGYLPVPDSFVA
jgi:hypothetical protein